MGAEDLGKQTEPQEPAGSDPQGATGEGSTDPKAGATDPQGEDDDPDGNVVDSHGQPGINRERHDKEVADLNKKIADLEAQVKTAAETKEGREKLEKQVDDLKAEMADKDLSHKLELAGCVDLKAAKSRLEDFGGDVDKLKSECPYLFAEKKQTGSTGLEASGAASGGPAKTIRDALRG